MAGKADKKKLSPEESAKLLAETEKLRVETEVARAEARSTLAAARQAENEAHVSDLLTKKIIEDEAARRVTDDYLHVYQFNTAISEASVNKCMAKLREWDRLDPTCDIEVIFNSPGGAVIDGMALFDLLVRLSERGRGTHHVTVGAQGLAASMAGILLQAGDDRWIGRQSYLMIHEISAGAAGKIGEIKDSVKFYDAICERVVDIFVDRSEGKIDREEFVGHWGRTDWWLTSDEAEAFGFVDRVV